MNSEGQILELSAVMAQLLWLQAEGYTEIIIRQDPKDGKLYMEPVEPLDEDAGSFTQLSDLIESFETLMAEGANYAQLNEYYDEETEHYTFTLVGIKKLYMDFKATVPTNTDLN